MDVFSIIVRKALKSENANLSTVNVGLKSDSPKAQGFH